MSSLPAGSWDTHIHILDPDRFPYRRDRVYTPYSASLAELVATITTDNIVIVQASVEDTFDGLITHLTEAHGRYPDKKFRGTVATDQSEQRNILNQSISTIHALHAASVRCVRIQATLSNVDTTIEPLKAYIAAVANSYAIRTLGWSVAMHLPLKKWAELHDFLDDDYWAGVQFVADHNGSSVPADIGTPEFGAFIDLLRKDRLWVKISALHRRAPNDVRQMERVIKNLVYAAPRKVVWGSDWPHVNASASGLTPAPFLQVDERKELDLVREWLADEQWVALMVTNPDKLFG